IQDPFQRKSPEVLAHQTFFVEAVSTFEGLSRKVDEKWSALVGDLINQCTKLREQKRSLLDSNELIDYCGFNVGKQASLQAVSDLSYDNLLKLLDEKKPFDFVRGV